MLAGRLPFEGATVFEMSSSILKDPPPPLPAGVPTPVRALVFRCLEKRSEQRYTCSEILTALDDLQSSLKARAGSRGRKLWIATGVTATLLLGGVGWLYFDRAPVQLLSTGEVPSPNQEANDLFELAVSLARVQNAIPQAEATFDRVLDLEPKFSEARRFRSLYRVINVLNGYSNDASVEYLA